MDSAALKIISSLLRSIFNIGIIEDIAPETSGLVSVVDLHDRELVHKFVIDFELFPLEGGHDLLA